MAKMMMVTWGSLLGSTLRPGHPCLQPFRVLGEQGQPEPLHATSPSWLASASFHWDLQAPAFPLAHGGFPRLLRLHHAGKPGVFSICLVSMPSAFRLGPSQPGRFRPPVHLPWGLVGTVRASQELSVPLG